MNLNHRRNLVGISLVLLLFGSCTARSNPAGENTPAHPIRVVAVESFLADIAQQVAGDRFKVGSLIPAGLDPHAYEPTPKDLAIIAESDVLIINGGGLESWISDSLENVGGERVIIDASRGLINRNSNQEETADPADAANEEELLADADHMIDPHFWLDPNLVMHYIENIQAGFTAADPTWQNEYKRNASVYIEELADLDAWIKKEIEKVDPAARILVTNHESFGYFADRYGFQIIGAIIPSVSTGASPSAKHMAELIREIKATGAEVIFLETGANPRLADQIARDAGVRVIDGLASHSLELESGQAANYIALMKHNVQLIVEALQ